MESGEGWAAALRDFNFVKKSIVFSTFLKTPIVYIYFCLIFGLNNKEMTVDIQLASSEDKN